MSRRLTQFASKLRVGTTLLFLCSNDRHLLLLQHRGQKVAIVTEAVGPLLRVTPPTALSATAAALPAFSIAPSIALATALVAAALAAAAAAP